MGFKNKGLKSLEQAVYDNVYKADLNKQNLIFLSQYQRQVLGEIAGEIKEIEKFIKERYSLDFINASLNNCLINIGKLTGEVLSQEILESIFSNFCIGK